MWGQFLQRFECNLQFISYWDLLPKEVAETNLSTKRWPGHAQEFETAFALAAFPENVRHDAMRDQDDKEPLAATTAAGQKLIAALVIELTRYVREMIDGKKRFRHFIRRSLPISPKSGSIGAPGSLLA